MKISLLGLENSGSDAFFEVLSQGQTIQQGKKNIGTAIVPDARVNELSLAFHPKKTVYANLQFSYVDISVSIPYEEIRNVDTIVYVLRTFSLYQEEKINPTLVYDNFLTDLKIRDLDILDRFCTRNAKDLNKKKEIDWAKAIAKCIEDGDPLSSIGEQALEWSLNLGLVSVIPRFVILNMSEDQWKSDQFTEPIKSKYPKDEFLPLCLSIEREIAQLDQNSREEMLELYQINEPVLDVFLRRVYDFLGWTTFFTVGEDEVRAWTILKGSTSFVAAGKIHSDIQRGFIRAEVVHYDDFKKNHFNFKECKDNGCFGVEGKQYLVQDGDIVHFRFNV
jgi:ribosome-binding ATPase